MGLSLVQWGGLLIFTGMVILGPGLSEANSDNGQDQIILLNDSASALEDSDPGLSKSLAKLADEKEKEWEYKSVNKNAPPALVTHAQLQYRIKILKEAALEIKPTYPLIAQSLDKMAGELNRIIEKKQVCSSFSFPISRK